MPFYVYVLRSQTTGKTYVGHTSNLQYRLQQHNDPQCSLTLHTKRNRGPWKLVYHEEYKTRAEAMRRERFLKSGHGRDFIKRVILKTNNQ